MLCFLNSIDNASATNFITKMNHIGTRLSPWYTPHPYRNLLLNFPTFTSTAKLVYNFIVQLMRSSGVPRMCGDSLMILYYIESQAFTKSTNITHMSFPFSHLSCSSNLSTKVASWHSNLGVAPNWNDIPLILRSLCKRRLMKMITILNLISNNIMPL